MNNKGWQWVFLIEGIPSVLFGIVTWFYLPDFPHTAKFLTEEEREFATQRLDKDDHVHSTKFDKQEFWKTVTSLEV